MRPLFPAAMTALLFCAAAHATDLVVFEDGRGLRVSGFALADGSARLTLEDGGELGVPMSSIVAIERAIDADDPVPAEDANNAVEAAALIGELRANETWRHAAGRYADAIAASADRNVLDRALLAAVAKVESNFNPYAISPRGAAGILQLMPQTAKRFGVKTSSTRSKTSTVARAICAGFWIGSRGASISRSRDTTPARARSIAITAFRPSPKPNGM